VYHGKQNVLACFPIFLLKDWEKGGKGWTGDIGWFPPQTKGFWWRTTTTTLCLSTIQSNHVTQIRKGTSKDIIGCWLPCKNKRLRS
jgi:hypothetical protein